MNLLGRAWESLTERGLKRSLETARSLFEDVFFDLRYGTDTRKRVRLTELATIGEKPPDASPYFPTRGRAFKALLRHFDVPPESVFVDLGSGKGKILLLACDFGFSKVVGVEFSRSLCTIAHRNVARYFNKRRTPCNIDIVCGDVANYAIRRDENVFFLFHPFGASVMERFIDNLQESLSETPRLLWVIYTLPIFRGMLEQRLGLRRELTYFHGGFEFVILSNSSTTSAPHWT
jgi:predicted RNA methylase